MKLSSRLAGSKTAANRVVESREKASMTRTSILNVIAVVASMLAAACGGENGMMTGPSRMPGVGTMLLSVTPSGGATGVAADSTLVVRFSGPMSSGMESFVDLHQGGRDGPLVAMRCGFSADRATLTCTPGVPLAPRATYTLHVGGGIRGSADGSSTWISTVAPWVGSGSWAA